MATLEGDRHGQRAPSRIDILDDLIIGESRRSSMVIAKTDDRMLRKRNSSELVSFGQVSFSAVMGFLLLGSPGPGEISQEKRRGSSNRTGPAAPSHM